MNARITPLEHGDVAPIPGHDDGAAAGGAIQPSAQEARQGRQGKQVLVVLSVSVALTVIAYAALLAVTTA